MSGPSSETLAFGRDAPRYDGPLVLGQLADGFGARGAVRQRGWGGPMLRLFP